MPAGSQTSPSLSALRSGHDAAVILRLLRIGVRWSSTNAALRTISVRGRPEFMHKKRKKHHSRGHVGVNLLEREARIDLATRPADGLGVAFLGASETVTRSEERRVGKS